MDIVVDYLRMAAAAISPDDMLQLVSCRSHRCDTCAPLPHGGCVVQVCYVFPVAVDLVAVQGRPGTAAQE